MPIKPEEQQIIRHCVSRGYLTTKQLQTVCARQQQLAAKGRRESLLQLLAGELSWSPEQIQHICREALAPSQQNDDIDNLNLAAAPVASGQSIGHYHLIRELGRGGMGVVYAARDDRLGRVVALKMALVAGQDHNEKERFAREAQLAAALNHPNIVAVHEVGEHEGTPFFTMDYIEGMPLKEYVGKKNPPLAAVVSIVADIAGALGFAHDRDIVHRDIKPGNILIDTQGKPHLTDFGLARNIVHETELTVSGAVLGTPAYMSPEQAAGRTREIGKPSDVYALGAVLYEMLTGRPPFTGNSMVELAVAINEHDALSPRKLNKAVPIDLEVVCLKCLEKPPARRYQDGNGLAADLGRYLQGKPIHARPASIAYRAGKWLRRHRSLAAGVLLLGCLLVFAWLWQFLGKRQELQNLLAQKDSLLACSATASDIERKYGLASEIVDLPSQAEHQIESSVRACMQAWRLLDQAAKIAPAEPRVKKGLYEVQKEIGALTLLGRNYMISQVFFARCKDVGDAQEAELLLQRVENKRQELIKAQLARIEAIMCELASPPLEGMVDEYVNEIVRMKGVHASAQLLHYIESDNEWQRRVCIDALGKLGDRTSKKDGRDVVEWLLCRLEKLQLDKDAGEMERIVWALGRLRDGRANPLVEAIRGRAGENSLFYRKTSVPYRWLPIGQFVSSDKDDAFQRGVIKDEKGDVDGAIAEYTRAILHDPKNNKAYNNRGHVRSQKGDVDGAIQDYTQAIAIAPDWYQPYLNRAHAYLQKIDTMGGTLDKAISDCNKVIAMRPESAEAFTNRGIARKRKGDIDGAITDYNQAIRLDVNNEYAYTNRAYCRYEKKDFDGAIEDCNKAIKVNPRSAAAYNNRGSTRREMQDFTGALQDFDMAINLNPKYSEAYANRGAIRAMHEQFAEAMQDFEQSIRLNPGYSFAYFNRANVRTIQQDYDGAIEDYSLALRLNPHMHLVYKFRGTAFAMKGDSQLAEKDLRRYKELVPGDDSTERVLQYLRQRKKR